LGEHLKINWVKLPIEDWKHYKVWNIYGIILADSISARSLKLLRYMEMGRPLAGKRVVDDGCVYGWLKPTETKSLKKSLSAVDPSIFPDDDLRQFHGEILTSLRMAIESNATLVILAH